MKTIRKLPAALALLSTLNPQLTTTFAQGTAFTYQGRLDSGGAPYTGLAEMQFSLWNAASGGSQLGSTLTVTPVSLTNGLFTVTLDFGAGVFTGPPRWLEIAVRTNFLGFTTLAPRQPITATPYAVLAGNVSGVIANSSLPSDPAFAGTVSAGGFSGNGGGLTNLNAGQLSGTVPAAALSNAWRIGGNAGTTPGTHFLGTTDNQPVELRANNRRAFRIEPNGVSPNLLLGAANNRIIGSPQAVAILGGGNETDISIDSSGMVFFPRGSNAVAANLGVIAGGTWNYNAGFGSSILGGYGNTIATNSHVGTIGGGYGNTINSGAYGSVIAGGQANNISSNAGYATIPGGRLNVATHYAFAAGNRAQAIHAGAFVWADSQNTEFSSTANNQFLIRASGGVGIGATNLTGALYLREPAGAPAGGMNAADSGLGLGTAGTSSYKWIQSYGGALALNPEGNAVGVGLDAPLSIFHVRSAGDTEVSIENAQGGRRWTLQSSSTNNAAIFAAFQIIDRSAGAARLYVLTNGNVGIGTVPTNKLHVAGGVSATAFVTTSDRNAKENFAPVSPCEVLAKVAALPISTWTFKEMPGARHMGPTAQDFHAAFGLGGSDTTITTVDPDGVALAAIQGLNQKLERENAALKARLERLEQLLESQLNGGAK